MLAILRKSECGTHRVSGCPVEDHDHGHTLGFTGMGVDNIESGSMSICHEDLTHTQQSGIPVDGLYNVLCHVFAAFPGLFPGCQVIISPFCTPSSQGWFACGRLVVT